MESLCFLGLRSCITFGTPNYTPGTREEPWKEIVFKKKDTSQQPLLYQQFSHTLLLLMILCSISASSLIQRCCPWSCVLYQPVHSYTVVHNLVFYISQFTHAPLLFMILCSISASSLIHRCCSWSCVLYQPVLSYSVIVHDLVFYISQFSHTLVSSLLDGLDNLFMFFGVPNKILLQWN